MVETARLAALTPDFAQAVQCHASDIRVSETTRLPYPYPEGGARHWLESLDNGVAHARELNFAILTGDLFVGTCGLADIDRMRGAAEYGYWVAFDHWGKGYATAAGWLMVDFARSQLGLQKLRSTTLKRNAASIRVLEKLGFRKTLERSSDIPKWPPAETLYDFEKTL